MKRAEEKAERENYTAWVQVCSCRRLGGIAIAPLAILTRGPTRNATHARPRAVGRA